MNIAVYCGANTGNHKEYKEAAELLGRWMADNGHRLIYGAGKVGMMGILCDTMEIYGGKITGVIPEFLYEKYNAHKAIDELYITKDMSERKLKMFELSDACIALTGGSGTLEEITESFSWTRLGLKERPCVFFNTLGFYNGIKEFYEKLIREGFLEEEAAKELMFTDNIGEMEHFFMNFRK